MSTLLRETAVHPSIRADSIMKVGSSCAVYTRIGFINFCGISNCVMVVLDG